MNPTLTPGGAAPKLSVVLPIYNERRTIEEVLRRVQDVAIDKEIVIVHDGSRDGSPHFLSASGQCLAATRQIAGPNATDQRPDWLRHVANDRIVPHKLCSTRPRPSPYPPIRRRWRRSISARRIQARLAHSIPSTVSALRHAGRSAHR